MYIGKVAELTGASRKAIRLYESLGLIPSPERAGSYRTYTAHHLTLIGMIKRAQAVGFKLAELSPLIEQKLLTQQFPLDFALQAIDHKRAEVQEQIDQLRKVDAELLQLRVDLPQLAS